MNLPHRRDRRRGASLIELMLVIGGVTIVLGLCAGLLHALLRLDRSGRSAIHDTATVARLARRFRQDARAADAAKPREGKEVPAALEFTTADGPNVTYRVEGKRLLREEAAGKTVQRRESYAVDRLGPVAFGVDAARVRLVLSRRPTRPDAPGRPAVRVEATLGKDKALSEPKGAKK